VTENDSFRLFSEETAGAIAGALLAAAILIFDFGPRVMEWLNR
jgi:hypothetical protein